jgi:nicotinamide riboside transporter PnuC
MKMSKEKIFEIISALSGIIGILLVSFKQPLIGFIILTIGSLFLAYYCYITKQRALMLTGMVYFVIDLIGVINWLN